VPELNNLLAAFSVIRADCSSPFCAIVAEQKNARGFKSDVATISLSTTGVKRGLPTV
jgi:hypothetical protein